MKLKKPKFWDYKKPNILAFALLPLAIIINFLKLIKFSSSEKKFRIKTICIGNFYVGGTGKTSLSLKINEILLKQKIKSCFIKKFYKDQVDEQKILELNGKLFVSRKRVDAILEAEKANFDIAILDDGLQDKKIKFDKTFVCFNNVSWIGNGLTLPAGPLRENIKNLRNYENVFLNGNLENIENLKSQIQNINPKINIHVGLYIPTNMNEFELNAEYLVFSGIGNHITFINMLKKNGFKILKDLEFPDHYEYSNEDLNKIINKANDLNCKIITTQKDFLRINKPELKKIQFVKSKLKILDEKKLLNSIL